MTKAMHATQAVALYEGAEHANNQRRRDQTGPEAETAAYLITEISAEHVEAGVRKIQHAHHAEDQRQPARHHEQQHAKQHAVQEREADEFEHSSGLGGGSLRTLHLAGGRQHRVRGLDRARRFPSPARALLVELRARIEWPE